MQYIRTVRKKEGVNLNKELDKLLCTIDGKITAFRMKHNDAYTNSQLIEIQKSIQNLWDINKKNKGTIKKVV